MTWFKIDDALHSHPKWLAASPEARALWVTAGSWCAAHLTDGHVPSHVLPVFAAKIRDADELVRIGLWDELDDGWQFHDWEDFQPSAESVEAERAAARERQRRARDKARESRRDARRDNHSDIDRDSRREFGPPRHGPPDPTRPDLYENTSSNNSHNGTNEPVDDETLLAAVPGEVWVHYADLMLERQPTGTVKQPVAWKRKTRETANIEHGDKAAQWWADFHCTPRYLAECLADGRTPRNEFRRKEHA